MMEISKINKVKVIVNSLGGTIENEFQIDWGKHLKIQDAEGYQYYTESDVILACETLGRRFSVANPYTIENIRMFLKNKGHNEVSLLAKEYKGKTDKLLIMCNCGEKFYRDWNHIQSSRKLCCPKCANKSHKRMNFSFVQNVFRENNLILVDKGLKDDNYYDCITNDGYKCRCYLWNIKNGIKADPFRENNPYYLDNFRLYVSRKSDSVFLNANTRQVEMKCSCGKKFTLTRTRFWSATLRCDDCNRRISSNEMEIIKYLENIGEEYNRQHRFKECRTSRPLPFDFYLPKRNLCIEVQGEQHYNEIPIWKSRGGLKSTQLRDSIKREYCNENGIVLIEISYKDIKNKSYVDKLNKILKQQ